MRRVGVPEIAQLLRCIVQVADVSLFERGVHQLLQAYQALRLFIPDFSSPRLSDSSVTGLVHH
jgi:hypothetical protein